MSTHLIIQRLQQVEAVMREHGHWQTHAPAAEALIARNLSVRYPAAARMAASAAHGGCLTPARAAAKLRRYALL